MFFGEISFSLPILIVRTFSKHLAFLKQSLLLPYILSGPSSSSSSADERRVYACWSNDEETMLLRLRAENFDRLKSREARKAWENIAKEMKDKFGTKKTTDKYQKKMKYLVDRYKQAKDWNSKQSEGNGRKSAHYDEIDEVLGCRDIVTF